MSNAYRTKNTEQIAPRMPHALLAAVRLYAEQRDVSASRAVMELVWQALRQHGLATDIDPP